MRKLILIRSLYEGVDTVVYIFLDAIVDRAFAILRASAIIVNAKTTTTVNKLHLISHLMKIDIEL